MPHLGPLLRLALLLLAPLIFACAGDDDAGCTVDTDCPGGFLCTDGRCQPPHAEREPAGEFADEGAGTDSETVGEEPEADAGADAEDDGSLSADADEVQPEEDPAPDAEAEAEAEAQETEGESPCIPDCSGQCSGAADGCGGTCPEGACPGCCVGTVCVAPTSREACGAASSACVDCAATLGSRADRCSPAGACACGDGDAACGEGWSCRDGACEPGCIPDCTAQCAGANDGCGGTCPADTCPAGCCGTQCCTTGQVCNAANLCCTPLDCDAYGFECGLQTDGCGGTNDCGTCGDHQGCDADGQCACTHLRCGDHCCAPDQVCHQDVCCTPAWVNTATCDCTPTACTDCDGEQPQADGCGNTRAVSCTLPATGCATVCCADTCCPAGEVCYGSACCAPQGCFALGFECGERTDGCGGTQDCGDCGAHEVCDPSGRCVCEHAGCLDVCCAAGEVCHQDACCAPVDCAAQGVECGSRDDTCGGTLDCGPCPTHFQCQPDGRCRLASTCVGPAMPAPTTFGFNYAPQDHLGKWVASEYAEVEAAVAADLVILASLGTRVARIMLLPYSLGLKIERDIGPGQWDQDELDALRTSLPAAIERFRAHGIAVVLALGPNAYYWNGPTPEERWWQVAYGANGWADFVADLVAWSTEVVEIVETSDACSNVLYYDLHNEIDYGIPGMHDLVTAQLRDIPVPDGKRGISVLHSAQASSLQADLSAAGTTLDALEFHSYPDRGAHSDIASEATLLGAQFPGVHLVLGEFGGIYCENGESEDGQRDTVLSVLGQAEGAGLTAALHWMLWDRQGGTGCADAERIGLGYSVHEPRDSWGALGARQGALPDADFEDGLGDWYDGGTTAARTLELGSGESDAATNAHYGRLSVTAPGLHWMCSPRAPVSGTALAVSGYVRSNVFTGLGLGVHFYGAAGEIGQEDVSFDIPAGWEFHSLQAQLGGVLFDLPGGTTEVIVCATIPAPADASDTARKYLDLDGLSVSGLAP